MQRYAIIVAGGKGLRMGSELPKQFMMLGSQPILMHTIERFYRFDNAISIVLVLPESEQSYWHNECARLGFDIPHTVVMGGSTRFHSVANGLRAIGDDGLVAIHDGVRPLVSHKVIDSAFEAAANYRAAIPVVAMIDSLRQIENGTSVSVDRVNFRAVQTPQTFDVALLKAAYKLPYSSAFTDDASVVEAYGGNIHLVEGSVMNIKITTPTDLLLAQLIMANE